MLAETLSVKVEPTLLVTLEGETIWGGPLFRMANVTEQVAVLFEASLTENRMFVLPTLTRVPGGGAC